VAVLVVVVEVGAEAMAVAVAVAPHRAEGVVGNEGTKNPNLFGSSCFHSTNNYNNQDFTFYLHFHFNSSLFISFYTLKNSPFFGFGEGRLVDTLTMDCWQLKLKLVFDCCKPETIRGGKLDKLGRNNNDNFLSF